AAADREEVLDMYLADIANAADRQIRHSPAAPSLCFIRSHTPAAAAAIDAAKFAHASEPDVNTRALTPNTTATVNAMTAINPARPNVCTAPDGCSSAAFIADRSSGDNKSATNESNPRQNMYARATMIASKNAPVVYRPT